MPDNVHIDLPDGWTSREFAHNGESFIEIAVPLSQFSCSVTVDLKRRSFRRGYACSGPFAVKTRYTGRGWREHLITDAVAWLQGVIGKTDCDECKHHRAAMTRIGQMAVNLEHSLRPVELRSRMKGN